MRRYGLPLWFAVTTASHWLQLFGPWVPGFDTELAVGAARNWLSGGDPWAFSLIGASGNIYHFAGLPPTLFVYAPLVPLGTQLAGYVGLVISLVAAVAILRRLGLPMWWLLFPPLNEGVAVANPHIVLLALLVVGGGWLAPAVKVYAFVPMLGERRWRQLGPALVVFGATIVAAPELWWNWATTFAATNGRLMTEAQGGWALTGAAIVLGIIPIVVIAWQKDLRTAGWLAVPAAWPASEFFYSTFALPVMTPVLAVFLAVPQHVGPPLAIAVYALYLVWTQRAMPRLVLAQPFIGLQAAAFPPDEVDARADPRGPQGINRPRSSRSDRAHGPRS